MNWDSIAFDWNQVRAFLATAEEGSLSAAARALGTTQPTLGRQVTSLEIALGVVLFERAGRGLMITPSGLELLDHVRDMAEAAGRVSLAATGQNQAIEGQVRISTSDVYAAYLLPPVLEELQRIAPAIEVDILATNSLSDLRRREADIAIRHVRPEEPDLISKLVRTSYAGIYASTSYLNEHGRPTKPDDLGAANFIGFESTSDRMLTGLNGLGFNLTRRNFKLCSESGIVAWEMVKRGLGIGVMMDDVAQLTPGIERILSDLPPFEVPVWLTAHRELRTSRRIRLVFDLLSRSLS